MVCIFIILVNAVNTLKLSYVFFVFIAIQNDFFVRIEHFENVFMFSKNTKNSIFVSRLLGKVYKGNQLPSIVYLYIY